MSYHSRNTGAKEVNAYVKKIKDAGISIFYLCDLPAHLYDMRLHIAAAKTGLLEFTGNMKMVNRNWVKEWEVV